MAVEDLIKALREKPVLGEYGAFNRPFVVIDVDEYHAILSALEARPKRGRPKVPRETIRA